MLPILEAVQIGQVPERKINKNEIKKFPLNVHVP